MIMQPSPNRLVTGWVSREGMVEKQLSGSVPGWISIISAAGAVFKQEPLWLQKVLTFSSFPSLLRARRYLFEVRIVTNQLRRCFNMRLSNLSYLLQVFRLNVFVDCGVVSSSKKFLIFFDWVAIGEEQVRCLLFRVQFFVRSPHFTQKTFSVTSEFQC